MQDEKALGDLLATLYEASGSRDRWCEALNQISEIFRASAVSLYLWNIQTREFDRDATLYLGYQDSFIRSYAHYIKLNPYMKSFELEHRPAEPFLILRAEPSAEVLEGEFYNEWVRPQKLWSTLAGSALRQGCIEILLVMLRHRNERMFTEREERRFRAILPHLRRSLELQRRISALQMTHESAMHALDQWPTGVILLGVDGSVLLMNRTAERIVNQSDGLACEGGFLKASCGNEDAALRRIINDAIGASYAEERPPGGAIGLSRRSVDRPLSLLVTPIRSFDRPFMETRPCAVIFISNPDSISPAPEVLRTVYHATPAEIRVAILLAQGRSVREIGEELHVSLPTVRTHLARLLDKTGARRQAELVRLLLAVPKIVGA